MTIQNAKEMIDTNLTRILDMFNSKLDSINVRTLPIEEVKKEPVEPAQILILPIMGQNNAPTCNLNENIKQR